MDTTELQKQINELQQTLNSLKASSTVPYEIGEALRDRILSGTVGESSTTAASKTVTITGTPAAAPMTGFITLNLNGITYNIPYY